MSNPTNNTLRLVIPREKINPKSPLRMLARERQDEIFDYLNDHSMDCTVKWLGDQGFQTSKTAICNWRIWYICRRQDERNTVHTEAVMARKKQADPSITENELFRFGQILFSRLSVQQEDSKAWARIQNLRFKELQIALARQLLSFREKEADRKEAALASGGLSRETLDQIERDLNLL